jgi:hypothetical protein
MTNGQLAARLLRIVCELQQMGENDMGNLPARCAGAYHDVTDTLRMIQSWIASIAENEEPPDPPGWEGGFADNH